MVLLGILNHGNNSGILFLYLFWFQVFGDCHSTQISDEAAAKYRVMCGSPDSEIFLEFCLHSVLYQLPSQRSDPVYGPRLR